MSALFIIKIFFFFFANNNSLFLFVIAEDITIILAFLTFE